MPWAMQYFSNFHSIGRTNETKGPWKQAGFVRIQAMYDVFGEGEVFITMKDFIDLLYDILLAPVTFVFETPCPTTSLPNISSCSRNRFSFWI